MIHIARGDGLPGDKSFLRKGCETCKSQPSIVWGRDRRKNSSWATTTLRALWKTRDPNFAVRLALFDSTWHHVHAFHLLSLKYQNVSCSAWSTPRRRDKVFLNFAKSTIIDMCRAGLRLSTIMKTRVFLAQPLLRIVAACVIQRHWRCARRHRAATTIQAAWRSHSFRKAVLHNPHTSVGHRWLARQACIFNL